MPQELRIEIATKKGKELFVSVGLSVDVSFGVGVVFVAPERQQEAGHILFRKQTDAIFHQPKNFAIEIEKHGISAVRKRKTYFYP